LGFKVFEDDVNLRRRLILANFIMFITRWLDIFGYVLTNS